MNSNPTLREYLLQRHTRQTASAYEREIHIFISNFPSSEKAVYKDIMEYIGRLRLRYGNASTINRILCSIKVWYDYLNYCGKRHDNPARSIRLRDRRSRDIQLQDLFTAEELESLLEREERYEGLALRNRVLMSLLVYQALLPQEASNVKLSDIDLQKGTLRIHGSAKANGRVLLLKPDQIMLFYRYIHESRPKLLSGRETDHLLAGHRSSVLSSEDIAGHVLRNYGNRFEGRRVNAKSIRQSVIANLLRSGVELRKVQVFAGHKYPGTTERYKQDSADALKTAVNLYHPVR